MLVCFSDMSYGSLLVQPSEFNTYYDIEAVYNCLRSDYGIKQEEIILYGQSVGSGPTLHMTSRLKRLRGVVLHSAILSGIRVLYPVKMTLWFDIFKVNIKHTKDVSLWSLSVSSLCLNVLILQNIDKIRHVNSQVLVIHVRKS